MLYVGRCLQDDSEAISFQNESSKAKSKTKFNVKFQSKLKTTGK